LEHLELFCVFKGIEAIEAKTDIDNIVQELRLSSFLDNQVSNLSGGQQRRVAVAIALLG